MKPVFVDVDINSGAITADSIASAITKKTKAIVIVHLAGWPAEMDKIVDLAKKNSLKIIEDCSQAHGAKLTGKNVGTFGDIATWSFCQDKIITTGGEGGMLTTNSHQYFNKVWSFRDHGKSRELILKNEKSSSFSWVHDNFGSNFRMTEMQSILGRIQLKRLENWILIRNRNAKILRDYLLTFKQIRVPIPEDEICHAYYKFYCYVDENKFLSGWSRERFINELNQKGYPAFTGSCMRLFRKMLKNIEYRKKEI